MIIIACDYKCEYINHINGVIEIAKNIVSSLLLTKKMVFKRSAAK